ncbi:MAG: lysylphosphatidylglycerol synthase transmembrane domain-containing protein [bacterium]
MSENIKKIGKYLLTTLILVGSMYLAVRKIDIQSLISELKTINWFWALIPIPIMILSHYIRAIRWKTILKPIIKPKSMLNLFSAVMVGYFFNNISPRGGELLRPYVYAKREKVSFSMVFATIILERLLDVLTLLFLFVIALIFAKDRIINAFPPGSNIANILYLVLVLALIVALCFYPPVMQWILDKTIKPLSSKLYHKIGELFEKFSRGFSVIKSPSEYLSLTLESLLIWTCYAIPMYLMFFCFNFSNHISLGFLDALLLIIISGIGVSIAPTPGGIGVFHYVVMIAMMKLYGLSSEEGFAYATINHLINFGVQVILGLVFFLRERITKVPENIIINTSEEAI